MDVAVTVSHESHRTLDVLANVMLRILTTKIYRQALSAVIRLRPH